MTSREITENNTNFVNNGPSVVHQFAQPLFAPQLDKSQLPVPPVTSREAAADNLQQNKPRSIGQVPSMPSVPKEIHQQVPDKQEPDFDALAKRFDSLRKR